jgi:outer membrane lipoprotein-sorting protein
MQELCKTPLFAQFLCQVQILILKILNVFLWLKFSPSLNLNKNEHFSKVSMPGTVKYFFSGFALSATIGFLQSIGLLLLLFAHPAFADTDPSKQFLDTWLTYQAQVKTWSADVVQIRKLKSLVHPLKSRGRVWFRQPNRFRWQLGQPPRTIAVRTEDQLLIVYPRLKQIEQYSLGNAIDPSWKQVLALLEVGFPSDPDAFHARYEMVQAERSGRVWHFKLRPADKQARRLLKQVRLEISIDDLTLLATELVFPGGSTMRNQFSNYQLNPDLDDALFKVEIAAGYQVVNPLQGRK